MVGKTIVYICAVGLFKRYKLLFRMESAPVNGNVDKGLGAILLFCVVFGSLGNITSLRYFLRKGRDLPTCIYIATTVTDTIVCIMALSPALSLLINRNPVILGYSPICSLWGIYIAILPSFTIALMALLSTTRTFTLHFPLRRLSRFNSLLFIASYFVCLVVIQSVIFVRGNYSFYYDARCSYCYGVTDDKIYEITDAVFKTLELAVPIPLIIISSISSSIKVMKSTTTNTHVKTTPRSSSSAVKRHATVTIILITVIYVILNIPMFLLYLCWSITKIQGDGGDCVTRRHAVFMKFYAWSITRVVSYTLNATLNPFVYLTRIKKYRYI